ncbi:hypothetical protein Dimus_006788 [Dionaea muscipula]
MALLTWSLRTAQLLTSLGAPAIPPASSDIAGCGVTLEEDVIEVEVPPHVGTEIVLLKQLATNEHFPSFSELDME